MKTKKLINNTAFGKITILLILGLLISCSSMKSKDQLRITGLIEQQQITSYQYGTHTISGENGIFYALKSETVDLDDFLGQTVTIIAERIEGYPVDGGPPYLNVLRLE